MSVLIKGMEMPKNCYLCHFVFRILDWNGVSDFSKVNERVFCTAKEPIFDISETLAENRADDCPLIELPSPHGKLIDVSSLDPYNDMWKRKCIPMEMVYNARAVAYEAPAIIEAEEGET